MAVTIRVPGPLRECCGGASEIQVSASNVREALARIEQQYPSLYRSICDETGAARRPVGVFVNSSHMGDREKLDTQLVPGDVVTVLPAVSGG